LYRPDKFASTYNTEGGLAIWAFLNRDVNITRMETASYLARPAIEPLAPYLLKAFGTRITHRRIKQMMGHMVRQIMESHGYHLKQSNVRITRKGNFFASASRYVLPEGAE
jgi:hypothetical protein